MIDVYVLPEKPANGHVVTAAHFYFGALAALLDDHEVLARVDSPPSVDELLSEILGEPVRHHESDQEFDVSDTEVARCAAVFVDDGQVSSYKLSGGGWILAPRECEVVAEVLADVEPHRIERAIERSIMALGAWESTSEEKLAAAVERLAAFCELICYAAVVGARGRGVLLR